MLVLFLLLLLLLLLLLSVSPLCCSVALIAVQSVPVVVIMFPSCLKLFIAVVIHS